jgi:hypothetical protein
MTTEYKIDFRHQIRSFRENFVTLAWAMVSVVIGTFVIQGLSFPTILVIGLLFWLVTSVAMAVPFHIQYLQRNWTTKLLVDNVSKTIEIQENGQVFKYNFSDISTERHLLGHYRPDREKSWQPIPFDYYGYVKIKTKDKRNFIITSLMADPFNFPLTIDSTKYRFTFIEKDIPEGEIKRRNDQIREQKINEFTESFDKLTDDKLLFKIENRDKFDKEAITAAERIIEQRKKITTANKKFMPAAGDVQV